VTAAPVIRAASAGAARRLVQSAVVFLVLAASSSAALLGLALLATAREGFDATCAVTHCAQLAVTVNASKVTAAQLARTRHLPGVTQAAGPYPQTSITLATGSGASTQPAGPAPASGQQAGRGGTASAQSAGPARSAPPPGPPHPKPPPHCAPNKRLASTGLTSGMDAYSLP
jgi:hypothetical protein